MKPACDCTETEKSPSLPRAAPAWLIVAAGSLVVFSWLAAEVVERQSLAFDSAMRVAIHQQATPPLTFLMREFSLLGSGDVMLPLVLVIVAVMLGAGIRRNAILLIIVLSGASLLEATLKLAFHRARPQPFFDLAVPGSYAFPSGHATVSLCFYTALAWIVSPQLATRWLRVMIWTAAALLIGLIGLSRIYLGVYYPSDVLGGYALGLVWMASMAKLRNWPRSAAAASNSSTNNPAQKIQRKAASKSLPKPA